MRQNEPAIISANATEKVNGRPPLPGTATAGSMVATYTPPALFPLPHNRLLTR